ncbi:putative isomerase YbhE [Lophiostoma macrostomum CBS 122681]|uniref:Putative isomerase YbhE n=1 Tax=Lophiostoma macrostomum CBS 122681 TaxID=1314788 RepID=A0A6A6T7Y2_9PLEO|nr:putative isomerase YbhE [Lophiostoma macrostomum CBS 122681]
MLLYFQLLIPVFGNLAVAQNLYATHYSGTVNYLTFSGSSLTLTSSARAGNTLPSWITYDSAGKALYVPDENFNGPTGTLVSFSIGANGALTQSGKATTQQGVVATALYGGSDGKGFIANAHYQSSQLTTYKLPLSNGQALQTLKFTMAGKGPVPSRQDAPHPHHAFTDPTGDFLLVPDLGADLIRIYQITKSSGQLTECPAGKAPGGTGPRHGTFWTPPAAKSRIIRKESSAAGTVLFVANELGNSVSAWSVTYASGGCMSLALKQTLTPYSGNSTAPARTKVAEVHVKDNFLYSTNRNDKKFTPNDSISLYTISSTGSLTWTENTSSYGTYPRTFDISKDGSYIAIGDQTTANVAIVKRDTATGKLTGQAATLRIGTAGTPENEDGLRFIICKQPPKPPSLRQILTSDNVWLIELNKMKTDNYLTLCLEQAANSPLHYRHGCIIVRGGKVIGQGFNDHRSGYDGGALKTGRLPARDLDGPSIVEFKKKKKLKRDLEVCEEKTTATFTPFKGMGGGQLANTPLSMHSEMMAIHSALSASTLASSMVSSQKPYFKLSGNSKPKARLRREAIKIYAKKVCNAALEHGHLKALHLNRAKLEPSLTFHLSMDKEEDVAASKKDSIEKHRKKDPKKHRHQKAYMNHENHKQYHGHYAHRLSRNGVVGPYPFKVQSNNMSDKTSTQLSHSPTPRTQAVLLPKGRTGQTSRSVSERMKDPRLNGADLYVARLGRQVSGRSNVCCSLGSPEQASSSHAPKSSTGSLHEELINPYPRSVIAKPPGEDHSKEQRSILASRPCYRCISYMDSVGIKRVFWTTDSGKWEGAKVRDLVDAMDSLCDDNSTDSASLANVFVTKHEVLMLRRTMAEG